jgi:hypothetical protein
MEREEREDGKMKENRKERAQGREDGGKGRLESENTLKGAQNKRQGPPQLHTSPPSPPACA